jgi:hypothetical protein
MSRPVSIRASYREDAAYLIRLEAAVEKDGSQSEDWRRETSQMLRKLSLRFLEADGSKTKAKGTGTVPKVDGKGPSTR